MGIDVAMFSDEGHVRAMGIVPLMSNTSSSGLIKLGCCWMSLN